MPTSRSITLAEAVSLFLADRRARGYTPATVKFYAGKLGFFCRWCEGTGVTHLDHVTPHVIRAHFAYLIDRGNNQGGQNAAGRAIRTLIRWCIAEELIDTNPLRNVRIPTPSKQVLPAFTPHDVKKLLAVAPDERATALVLFLLDTGMRVSEVARLNGEDIDLSAGTVAVRTSKTGRSRIAFLSAQTRKTLIRYYKRAGWAEGAEPVWRTTSGDNRITSSGIRQILKAMGNEAGVKGASPHQFRRTFAIWSLRRGVNLHVLARLMGHAGITVLRQYLDITDTDLSEAHRQAAIVESFLK